MRTLTCMLVGLAFALAGCDSDMRSQLESDVKRLEAKCDALKRENETMRLAVDNLRAEKTLMEKDVSRLKSDNNSLKRQLESEKGSAAAQIEQLKAQLAAAKQGMAAVAAAASPGSGEPTAPGPLPARSAPGTPPAPVRDEAQIAEVERAAAELDAKIAALQARVNQGRSKAMSLIRSTVDTPMVPPAGGGICPFCSFYNHPMNTPMIINSEGKHIGPAIKRGDFRSVLERDKAIQTAKEESLPLEQELKTLRDELTKTKEKLAKLRAAPAPN